MARNKALVRALRLWRLLDGRRYRPPTLVLARHLQVTTRTIYRDIGALEEAHLPVPPPVPREARP